MTAFGPALFHLFAQAENILSAQHVTLRLLLGKGFFRRQQCTLIYDLSAIRTFSAFSLRDLHVICC